MQERQKELSIKGLAPKETADNSSAIMEWLKNTGASKVVIHFDLDVIDPADMIAGVGVEPDGMKTCLLYTSTRDAEGFKEFPIPSQTPDEFLKLMV